MTVHPYWQAILLVCLCACSDEPGRLPPCDRSTCPEECLALSGPNCDVREKSCDERILKAVQCTRGIEGRLPEIRVLTEEEVRKEDAEEEPPAPEEPDAGVDAGAESPSPANYDAEWETALKLLHLRAQVSETQDATDLVAGYYDPEEQRITLVDRGESQNDEGAQRTFAHELVHAFQDQQVGFTELSARTGRSTDAALARGTLTEGDAVLYEDLSFGLLKGLSVDEGYWDVTFEWRIKNARDRIVTSDSPIEQVWLLRYGLGARYLADAWLENGNWGVFSLYERPPIATVYFMHGYEASKTRTAPLTAPLACNDAAPPPNFERVGRDSLGAFVLYAFLGHNLEKRNLYPTEKSWQRALAWRQDQLALFVDAERKVAISWRVLFADEATAREVHEDLSKVRGLGLQLHLRGRELEILASELSGLEWKGTSPKRCPEPE